MSSFYQGESTGISKQLLEIVAELELEIDSPESRSSRSSAFSRDSPNASCHSDNTKDCNCSSCIRVAGEKGGGEENGEKTRTKQTSLFFCHGGSVTDNKGDCERKEEMKAKAEGRGERKRGLNNARSPADCPRSRFTI